MKDLFKINILDIEYDTSSEADGLINGVIHLTSKDESFIDRLNVSLKLVAKGKLEYQEINLDTFTIIKARTSLTKDKKYELKFALKHDSKIENYIGRNVTLNFVCKVRITLSEDYYDQLDKSIIHSIKTFFSGDKTIKHSIDLPSYRKGTHFEIDNQNIELEPNSNSVLGLVIGFSIGLTCFIVFENFHFVFIFFIGFLTPVVIMPIQNSIYKKILGKITATVKSKDDDSFECAVEFKNPVIRQLKPKASYIVEEYVLDTRGTSNSNYTETIHSSRTQLATKKQPLTFEYPKTLVPPSTKLKNVEINWKVLAHVTTRAGFNIKAEGLFKVKRSPSLINA